jgi:hypothetical protein
MPARVEPRAKAIMLWPPQVLDQRPPQPGPQLSLGSAVEFGEVSLRFDNGFLHQLGSTFSSTGVRFEVQARQPQQVGPE